MGRLVAETVAAEPDLELVGCFDPGRRGETIAGVLVGSAAADLAGAAVVVEFTTPDVVIENLETWRALGLHAVVGTSGFDAARLAQARTAWGSGPPNCFIAPNFSIGAVVMMRLAEIAAPHFSVAEVIELHHDRKVDAPSGTALATAERIAAAGDSQNRAVESSEIVRGARGATVSGVTVHSVRMPGLVSHQEVLFGRAGETMSIRHDTTDLASFMPGVLIAIRSVAALPDPFTVGLEGMLGL